jgi:hypothetical protein
MAGGGVYAVISPVFISTIKAFKMLLNSRVRTLSNYEICWLGARENW